MNNTRLYIRCLSRVAVYLNPVILLFSYMKKAFSFYRNENIFAASNQRNLAANFDVVEKNEKIYVSSTRRTNTVNFCNKIV